MKKIAFVYPGQGSQAVGMGKDLYDAFPSVRDRYDKAEEILGYPLKKYSFEGPEETLRQTYVTQPALFVHSVAVTDILIERGIAPECTAGHSLGEYSALHATGAAGFSELLELVKVRGELMQNAGEVSPGTMAALIGADEEKAADICEAASSAGIVKPANFNAPGQIVISGSVDGVHEAMKIAKERGIKRAIELNVGGAFHSPLMESATRGLVEQIDATDFQTAVAPVYANATGEPMQAPETIRENLKKQLLSPVLWSRTIGNIAGTGVELFIETGSGKVLQGLAKRIVRDVPCITAGTLEEILAIEDNPA